jgi:ABC-type amino acid transport substrate-binding protein
MSDWKTRLLTALALAATACVFAAGAGCGGASQGATNSGDLSGAAAERAAAILGHAPAGLAKTIVDRGEIVVANDAHYAPRSSVDANTKEPVGFDVDVAKDVADILGLRIAWKHPVLETVPYGLRRGLYDVAIDSMPVTKEGGKLVAFSAPYYYDTGQVFVRKGGRQIAAAADLSGRDVGARAATDYWDWLKSNATAKLTMYATDADALKGLTGGEVDFWMTSGATGQHLILQGEPIEFSGPPLFYRDIGMATKEGETDLVALLDYAVATMHKDGSLSSASKKWFEGIDLTVRD